ncbi:5-oxoprolinase subunit PxpA [Azospirillum sp. ST 5-10]|uniref:5-oxoprolinase subunit PxpA n=1 Tax=unclassified Azospirillum TaxID=2630922 RepID=UPI003F4A1CF2
MTRTIDLNCDLGEGFGPWSMGDDDAMLDIVTTANVACGFHAGDPVIMTRTAALARDRGVRIGAHPGFNDLWGFGRRAVGGDSPTELERMIAYQVGALQGCAALAGHRVGHVKAHGALYNMAAVDTAVAGALARAVAAVDAGLVLVVPPFSAMERVARDRGLEVALEVFADRGYEEDGTLTPRGRPGAVIHDPAVAAARVVRMVTEGTVESRGGRAVALAADTVCVHGDTPGAVAMARMIRDALAAAGIAVAPFVR